MKVETWMHRITSETNVWLNAIKMEEEGSFFEAFFLYLKDAAESLKRNFLLRAALSCSCAANCLSHTGNLVAARQLYLRTAMLYETNGDSIIGESVREALWSYKESYEYYSLGCESEKSQIVYDKYVSLSRRINPFLGEEEAMSEMRQRKKTINAIKSDGTQTNIQISTQVENAMNEILRTIESICDGQNPDQEKPRQTIESKVKRFEKSFAS